MNNINFSKYINLSNLSPAQQQLFVTSMTNLILARLADMIGDHLTEQEIVELENLSKSGDPDAVINWLNTNIPNISQGIEEILKEESASLVSKINVLTDLTLRDQDNGNG